MSRRDSTGLTARATLQRDVAIATKERYSPPYTIRFAVFFSCPLGDGIELVEALDEAHASDITQAQFPGARLSVVPTAAIEGLHRQRLLMSWLDTL